MCGQHNMAKTRIEILKDEGENVKSKVTTNLVAL